MSLLYSPRCRSQTKRSYSDNGARHRKSEKEEDAELMKEDNEADDQPYVFEESPPCTFLSASNGWYTSSYSHQSFTVSCVHTSSRV